MGSQSSKPAQSHVFSRETPTRFSSGLVSTLESSPETDSTRGKTLELEIQQRVAQELQRLEARESEILRSIESKPSEDAKSGEKDIERAQVQRELDDLRKRLQGLPKLGALAMEVEAARNGVVGCLRKNESRPLDCWREVEEFRRQARSMERRFVVETTGRALPKGY